MEVQFARTYPGLARRVLMAFLCTFLAARIIVFLIMAHRLPDLFLHLGGTHVHHLNYGIFLLSGIGYFLLFVQPSGRTLEMAAIIYGIGLALTFDEFGMWLHLGGSYWQRASFDAVAVIAALLALIAYAPPPSAMRGKHWWSVSLILLLSLLFFGLLLQSFDYAESRLRPEFEQVEQFGPR